jgi:hypothetical protein
MRQTIHTLNILFTLTITSMLFNSCKKEFDAPPPPADPNLTVTHTIKQLKALHTNSGTIDVINTDMVIAGVVVANDKSGNLYKEIYIQDGSSGISVQLDVAGLHNSYPIGRKVFIKCKGLALSDYNRLTQLGIKATVNNAPSLQAIASNLISQFVVGGSLNNPVTPKVVTVNQLGTLMSDDMIGSLIQLNNYEFVPADTSKTFSDTSAYKNAQNLTVRNCQANSSIIIRTSGYADFAGINVPNGNGTLTAVYTVFGSTRQLLVRDTSDVKFYNPRCGQGATTVINISDLRALYTGTNVAAPDGKRITGIVISDRLTNNLNSQNIVLQQGNNLGGIQVRFEAPHSFSLGDSIDVNVSLQELSEFNQTMQVNNIPLAYAIVKATGKNITPRIATLAEINTNFEAWESTLVKTGPAAMSGGTSGTYAGNITMNDGASLVLYTATAASFATQSFPPNVASVTGYLLQFNAVREISVRNPGGTLNDVVSAGGASGSGLELTTSPYTQNFNNISSGLPKGVFVKIGATASSAGTGDMPVYGTSLATGTLWNQTSAGLKNFASATSLTATSDATAQNAATNRALGIRQTSSTGYDPGSSYLFKIDNTIGKSNLQLGFLLQSLDNSIGRTTIWKVQYGIGDNPSSFTDATTNPTTLNTANIFGATPVSVNFGSALNNISQTIWIRVVTLSATTGTGSRASTAIDDLNISWN